MLIHHLRTDTASKKSSSVCSAHATNSKLPKWESMTMNTLSRDTMIRKHWTRVQRRASTLIARHKHQNHNAPLTRTCISSSLTTNRETIVWVAWAKSGGYSWARCPMATSDVSRLADSTSIFFSKCYQMYTHTHINNHVSRVQCPTWHSKQQSLYDM